MHVSFVTKHTELWHLRAIYLMLLGPNHLLGPISWKIASEMTKNPSLKRFRWLSILADNLHFNTLIFLYILSFEKKYVIAKQLWLELGYANFCNTFMSNFGYNNHSTLFWLSEVFQQINFLSESFKTFIVVCFQCFILCVSFLKKIYFISYWEALF